MIPMFSVPMLSFSLRGAAPAIKVRTISPRMSMESDLKAVEDLKAQLEVLRLKQQIAQLEATLQQPPVTLTPVPVPAQEAAAQASEEAAAEAAEKAAAKAAEEAAARAAEEAAARAAEEAAAKAAEEAAARAAEEAAARAAQEAAAKAVQEAAANAAEEAAARAAQEAAALAAVPAVPSMPESDLKAIEDLKQQIELLRLKQQLAELKGDSQPPLAAVVPVPEPPAPVAISEAPPAVVAAIPKPPAPIAPPEPVAVPEPPAATWVLPTPAMEAAPVPATMPEAVAEPVVSALQQASNAPTEPPNMAIFFALLLIPIGAFGGQRFVDFVNTRYEEIGGTVGGGNYASAAAPDEFSPSSWAADAEVAAASGWDTGAASVGRSAPEIFWTAVDNFNADPTGWWFGQPSALYSNLPPPSSAAVAAASMTTAAAASTDMDFPMATPPPEAAPFEGRVVPSTGLSEGKAARRERRAKRK